jgi:hypothetical protein
MIPQELTEREIAFAKQLWQQFTSEDRDGLPSINNFERLKNLLGIWKNEFHVTGIQMFEQALEQNGFIFVNSGSMNEDGTEARVTYKSDNMQQKITYYADMNNALS